MAQFPTCPLHMLLKPCMHCEPSVTSQYGPPLTGKKVRRKAPTLRAGDRIYLPWGGKSFVGTLVTDAIPHGDGWVKFLIRRADGTEFMELGTPNEEYDVES